MVSSDIAGEEKASGRHWRLILSIIGFTLVLLIILGMWLPKAVDRWWNGILQSQVSHTTTGAVRAKEQIVLSGKEAYYISDLGDRIEVDQGTVQWRIYYEIDNFDQVPEPKRTQLIESELKRAKEYGMRFRSYTKDNKDFYDHTEIGDKLKIHYRYIGDQKEILSIENLTHP